MDIYNNSKKLLSTPATIDILGDASGQVPQLL
jgi:hypothetical protein